MKQALWSFTFAAALATGVLTPPPLPTAAPAVTAVITTQDAACSPGWTACTQEYFPVICSNGVVYENACIAQAHCATGCVPYGDV